MWLFNGVHRPCFLYNHVYFFFAVALTEQLAVRMLPYKVIMFYTEKLQRFDFVST